MNKGFIQIIAEDLLANGATHIAGTIVVLPTQRACAVLKRCLCESTTAPLTLPKIMSITEFVTSYSDKAAVTELYAVGLLYKAYQQKVEDAEPFEKFYPWGKILIRDFDEIDKNLTAPDKIFAIIDAQKSIDDTFSLPEEAQKVLEQFFGNAYLSDHQIKQSFIKIWQILLPLYTSYNEALALEGYAGAGLMYKNLIHGVAHHKYAFADRHIYFCGFNALTKAEEQLIDILSSLADVHLYWDADNRYMADSSQEAGLFLRRYKDQFISATHHWVRSDFLQGKKIHIIGAGSLSAQHAFVTQHIASHCEEDITAIALCEERALPNLLTYLPSEDFNITMGIQVQDLPHYVLINKYVKVFITQKPKSIYVKEWIDLIGLDGLRQALGITAAKASNLKEYYLYQNKHYLTHNFLETFLAAEGLFTRMGLLQGDFWGGMNTFFDFLIPYEHTIFGTNGIFTFIQHTLNAYIFDVNRLDLVLDNITWAQLWDRHIRSTPIPFDTAPNEKKQIMGILETRLLDFKNLYILNLNEGIMPASSRQYSFIPYNIKKAYGIPTHQEYDALYAYHFYRLLQRAENIYLLYQTSESGAEPSRYLLQLLYEYSLHNHIVHRHVYSNNESLVKTEWQPMIINKTPEIMEVLYNMKFSASALQAYSSCPAEFFYKYIAKIKEPESAIESTDDRLVGLLFHTAVEQVFQPYVGKPLCSTLPASLHDVENMVSEALQQAYHKQGLQWDITQLEGTNALDRDVLKKLLRQVIQKERENAEQVVIQAQELKVEKNIKIGGRNVLLTGAIDRLDWINNDINRVIDYKTGAVTLYSAKDKVTVSDIFCDKGKFDIQGYMYAYLLERYPVEVAFYDLTHHVRTISMPEITPHILSQFETALQAILSEILDESTPFIQKSNKDTTVMSAYASLLS